jgi:hypothetical protein
LCGRSNRNSVVQAALLLLCGSLAAGCMQKNGGTRVQEIPSDVREYLTAGDGLARKSVEAQHPDIRQKLQTPDTRAKLIRYLASDEPWQDPSPGMAVNTLGVLQAGAKQEEVPVIRPYLMHPQPQLRLRAYEFLMSVYYPAGERGSMLTLFQSMLLDSEDTIRMQGAQFIKGMKGQTELQPFLERWLKLAPQKGWDKTDSFGAVQNLVAPGQPSPR